MEGFRLFKKEPAPVIRTDLEESTTFYYSNFKLFHEDAEIMFSKYLSFKKDLDHFLGEEWHDYAKKCVYKKLNETTIYVQSQDIFNAALESWLEIQKENRAKPNSPHQSISSVKTSITSPEQSPFESTDASPGVKKADETPIEHKSEDNQKLEAFQQRVRDKFASHDINEISFNALIQAFYVSAIKVWKEMILGYFGDPTGKNGGFILESKKFLYNKLQTFYQTKSKMIKPILVATERIKDYVMDSSKKQPQIQVQTPDEKDLKNLSVFSSNFHTEGPSTPSNDNDSNADDEHDLKKDFKTLQINSNNNGSLLGKRSAYQATSSVEIKKISKKLEKLLNPTTIEFAAHYVNNMVKSSNLGWQISRNFVTNMVEVNYNKLVQLENQFSTKTQGLSNDVKIRFIQPAQDFYNSLMETWIIFKVHSTDREVLFTEYLEKVKGSLGNLWNERFVAPTQNFFMTLYYEWNRLKQAENDSEEKILFFTKKVKESMLKIWEESVVKKAEELSNRTIPTK